MNNLKIGNIKVGEDQPAFIIAEAGVNHNGRLDLALKLVDAAAEAGADAVKFQTFKAIQVVTHKSEMAEYQKKNTGMKVSQFEMLKKLEFDEGWYSQVKARCKEKKIIFLSSPHGGFESVDLLQSLNAPTFKFGSGDLTNLPLLKYVAKFKKPIILGTGMANMEEVQEAVKIIQKEGNYKIILLHCTTNYPCPLEEVNLRAMQTMMKKFPDLIVGYSDHTLGAQVPLMAVTLAAQVIEKHLTLDNRMEGPDHKASADPIVFKEMVEQIRKVETILGSEVKMPTRIEVSMRKVARKSLVALKDIKKGEKFSSENLGIKRPGNGLQPKYYFQIIGKKSKKDIKADTLIKL
jgi:N,N'-diacetyllegionaminate synthase